MRHPLWLINAVLLVLIIAVISFIFLDNSPLPKRTSLTITSSVDLPSATASSVSIEKIIENDLFDTHHKEPQPVVPQDFAPKLPALPQPALPTEIVIPAEPQPTFLPPLDIKLKGVITVDDESMNKALIADNKTTTETMYRAGDLIQDARIVKILSNRIIIVRSNGQQETLYLNENDLKTPYTQEQTDRWIHVVKKSSADQYLLDHEVFAQIIKNVAQCIDVFDITTVYKDGKSFGCKLGFFDNTALGYGMGLEPYDTILSINELPIATPEQRFAVYNSLLKVHFEDTITLELIRNAEHMKLVYTLRDLKDPFDTETPSPKKYEGITALQDDEDLEQEKMNILKQRYQFAQTVQDIKIEQKTAMLQKHKDERE